jgi:predicted MPP superfamily phosphohydrolase
MGTDPMSMAFECGQGHTPLIALSLKSGHALPLPQNMAPPVTASALRRPEAPAASPRLHDPAERQAWAERRRGMEAERREFGPDGPRSQWPSRIFAFGLAMVETGARLVGLHQRGLRNALDVELVSRSVSLPSLPPAFDGYRILHLSDTHLDTLPELVAVATRLLVGVEVDLLALTGDIHGNHRAPLAASTQPLADLIRAVHVRDRGVAVLGNHDPAGMAAALDELGFDVLINESTVLEREGERIVLTGLDDVHRFFTPEALRALSQAPAGFRIALVHSAEVADHAARAGYALYLCGHTHGGQICLPGGRPIVTRLRRCRHAGVGAWREGSMAGLTSRGLGVGDTRLRFNCRGEVTLITLRRALPD